MDGPCQSCLKSMISSENNFTASAWSISPRKIKLKSKSQISTKNKKFLIENQLNKIQCCSALSCCSMLTRRQTECNWPIGHVTNSNQPRYAEPHLVCFALCINQISMPNPFASRDKMQDLHFFGACFESNMFISTNGAEPCETNTHCHRPPKAALFSNHLIRIKNATKKIASNTRAHTHHRLKVAWLSTLFVSINVPLLCKCKYQISIELLIHQNVNV